MNSLIFWLVFGLGPTASTCPLGNDFLADAINGEPAALKLLDERMGECVADYRFYGLHSAIRFARPRDKHHRLQSMRNLSLYHDDELSAKLLALGFAIELHAQKQCRSVPTIIAILREIGASSPELEEELMLNAMHYGDIHVARHFAVMLKRRKDPQSLLEAAEIIEELKMRDDAAQHLPLLIIESRGLPIFNGSSEGKFRWIRDVPRNHSEQCNNAKQFDTSPQR
jgi:hypothetical protein